MVKDPEALFLTEAAINYLRRIRVFQSISFLVFRSYFRFFISFDTFQKEKAM